jgi:hypothetical protein
VVAGTAVVVETAAKGIVDRVRKETVHVEETVVKGIAHKEIVLHVPGIVDRVRKETVHKVCRVSAPHVQWETAHKVSAQNGHRAQLEIVLSEIAHKATAQQEIVQLEIARRVLLAHPVRLAPSRPRQLRAAVLQLRRRALRLRRTSNC